MLLFLPCEILVFIEDKPALEKQYTFNIFVTWHDCLIYLQSDSDDLSVILIENAKYKGWFTQVKFQVTEYWIQQLRDGQINALEEKIYKKPNNLRFWTTNRILSNPVDIW